MNAQFGWAAWLVLVSAVGIAGTVSCSGASFCGDSRTCAAPAADGGAAGAPVGETAGTAGSSQLQQGGQGGQNELGDGGAAGQPVVSTVGNACSKDPECDDRDSCTGVETCVDGACAAGKAVKCDVGMKCSAAKNDACVWSSDAPWIVYIADDDTTGVNEAYGVKSDLVGKMKPIKLSPALDAGLQVSNLTWAADGSAVVLSVVNKPVTNVDSYLVQFGDGVPEPAILLSKGMPASKTSAAIWSPTTKTIGLTRDTGFYAVDYAAAGGSAFTRVSADTMDSVHAWFKSDTEVLLVGRNVSSLKFSINLAERDGNVWTKTPLVSNLASAFVTPSPDVSTVGYSVFEAPTLFTSWTLETTLGSQPTKIAGPVTDIAIDVSNDGKFVLATTATAGAASKVFAGPISSLSSPPPLESSVKLTASAIIGPTRTAWAPDSSRAAVFQTGTFGRQLVMYEPDAASPWHALTEEQGDSNDGAPAWSPDSKVVALATRTAVDSSISMTLVSSPDYAKYDIDTVAAAGYAFATFSPAGEFLVYRKTANIVGGVYDGAYVDLRNGVANAGQPTALPGPVGGLSFATSGTAFVYLRGAQTCDYFDPAASAKPEPVNGNGTAIACWFQKLPR